MNRTAPVIVVWGIASLLIAGCSTAASPPGVGSPTPVTAPVTAAPTTAVVEVTAAPATVAVDVTALLPAGLYSAEIPAGLEAAPGKWTMRIASDGITWTNPENGATFSPGEVVEITSSMIVFGPDPGCPGQGATPTGGTYQWKLDAGQLTFTFVSDSCAGRRDTLAAAPWKPMP